jgi:hypothetical protein
VFYGPTDVTLLSCVGAPFATAVVTCVITDFLLSGNDVAGLGMEGRKQLAISPETFGLTQGLKPHPEELRLRAIDPDEDGETPPSDLYRPGSEVYPDMDVEP